MVTPILRALNAAMGPRLPGWTFGIGNAEGSKPSVNRLHWEFTGGEVEGGYQADRVAQTISIRAVGLTVVIRARRVASQTGAAGLNDLDYELAERALREVHIALDNLCSGDWQMGNEEWPNSSEPDAACVEVRQQLVIKVKVQHDKYTKVTPETTEAEGEIVDG